MDGTENDLLWDEEDDIPLAQFTGNGDQEDIENLDVYDDMLTAEEWELLFGGNEEDED